MGWSSWEGYWAGVSLLGLGMAVLGWVLGQRGK